MKTYIKKRIVVRHICYICSLLFFNQTKAPSGSVKHGTHEIVSIHHDTIPTRPERDISEHIPPQHATSRSYIAPARPTPSEHISSPTIPDIVQTGHSQETSNLTIQPPQSETVHVVTITRPITAEARQVYDQLHNRDNLYNLLRNMTNTQLQIFAARRGLQPGYTLSHTSELAVIRGGQDVLAVAKYDLNLADALHSNYLQAQRDGNQVRARLFKRAFEENFRLPDARATKLLLADSSTRTQLEMLLTNIVHDTAIHNSTSVNRTIAILDTLLYQSLDGTPAERDSLNTLIAHLFKNMPEALYRNEKILNLLSRLIKHRDFDRGIATVTDIFKRTKDEKILSLILEHISEMNNAQIDHLTEAIKFIQISKPDMYTQALATAQQERRINDSLLFFWRGLARIVDNITLITSRIKTAVWNTFWSKTKPVAIMPEWITRTDLPAFNILGFTTQEINNIKSRALQEPVLLNTLKSRLQTNRDQLIALYTATSIPAEISKATQARINQAYTDASAQL